jgi:hypothetical protein
MMLPAGVELIGAVLHSGGMSWQHDELTRAYQLAEADKRRWLSPSPCGMSQPGRDLLDGVQPARSSIVPTEDGDEGKIVTEINLALGL